MYMTRLLALVLMTLLVCSLPTLAVPTSVGPGSSSEISGSQATIDGEVIDWLTLSDGPAASGESYVAIDLGAALDDDANRLEARYDDHRIDARMEAADSDAERRAIIREEASQLSQSVAELRERERTAYMQYYRGERSERELLAELAVVHANAAALDESITTLDEHAAATPGVSLDSELEAMEVETLTMQGPVRERVADMLRGETEPTRVHVETNGEGVVIAVVEDDRFYREAHRPDHRDPDADSQYTSLGQSENRIAELYPSIFSDARWSYSEVGHSTHRGIGTHGQGSLTVFLDTGTGDVYREFQTLRLSQIDTTTLDSKTEAGVTVTVSQTVPGGPAKVTLTDAETDAPLSGEVALNNRTVGRTNADGEVWFVAPRDPMTVSISTGSTSVELTVSEESSSQGTARTDSDDEGS